MTAAENLARWREAEQGATEGPWEPLTRERPDWLSQSVAVDSDGHQPSSSIVPEGASDPTWGSVWPSRNGRADAAFIATSRDAMPKLLTFVEKVLALGHKDCPMDPERDPYTGCACGMDRVYRLAEELLGGAR